VFNERRQKHSIAQSAKKIEIGYDTERANGAHKWKGLAIFQVKTKRR
jgi:hypothetical protein